MYKFSNQIESLIAIATARCKMGIPPVLLLTGEAGGGKTTIAKEIANRLNGKLFRYDGVEDKQRDLLYDNDVDGILKRSNAWIAGAAWEAFEYSHNGFAVLLIDEVDKTHPSFDAFLLRILEEHSFFTPSREVVQANSKQLIVVLTSNGKRKFRPELLRRTQRINVPLPDRSEYKEWVMKIANVTEANSLLEKLVDIAFEVRKKEVSETPSPKETALCYIDCSLAGKESEPNLYATIAQAYMVKYASLKDLLGYNVGKALQTEANR